MTKAFNYFYISVTPSSNNYVYILKIQLPFACNAQIIKGVLPITTDKDGQVPKFLIFQQLKKPRLLPGAVTLETSLY